ncbi:MAG TPA: hypothetical protein VLD55_03825 [Candidatus Sulfobium mesophilum]|nr:hypothetical protein [Candidatus Sulfobium mesophilum]
MTHDPDSFSQESVPGKPAGWTRTARNIFLLLILIAALAAEGYYIFVLRDKIEKQTEELRDISIQLQSSKNESADLREELSSIKKMAGERKDGDTAEGQH